MSSATKDKPPPAKESPTSEVEEDSEYTNSSSSSDEGGAGSSSRAPFFGALRTRLRWDVDSRTLNLDVRCAGSTQQQQGGRRSCGSVVGLCLLCRVGGCVSE